VPNVDSAILLIENINKKFFDRKEKEVIFFYGARVVMENHLYAINCNIY
jgi:hypothetical protein